MRLRSSRPVKALVATGIAASTLVLASVPAVASTVTRHEEWWITALGVRRAWTASQGAGITVAVLSDGVNPDQVDLVGSVVTGPDYTGTGQSHGPYFGEDGTPIASLIAGHGHAQSDAVGIVGIAPLARILSVRVTLPSDDPALSQAAVAARLPGAIASGIRYAVNHGASIIDLPIDPGQPGASGLGGAAAAAGGSAAERAAVEYALAHNVVLIAPAGDDGGASDRPNYPAAYPGVISVGAFDSGFVKAPWTNAQSYVAVTSAGVNVVAAANTRGYQMQNSTAAASAIVAGIAALVRADFPGLSAAQVRTALTSGTMFRHQGGASNGSGSGAVNAQLALTAAEAQLPAADRAGANALPRVSLPTPAPHSPRSTVTGQLMTAGVVSGGLLVLLLLLIAMYTRLTKRRSARQQQAIAAEWAGRQAQSRYPQTSGADAERLLEYFAAPAAPAASAPGGVVAAPTARPVRVGRSAGATSGVFDGAAANGPVGAGAFGGTSALSAPPGWSPEGSRSAAPGPASRAVDRRAAVSGAPPWEPASQPDSELPWATGSSGSPPAGRTPGPPRPSIAPMSPARSVSGTAWSSPSGPAHAASSPGPAAADFAGPSAPTTPVRTWTGPPSGPAAPTTPVPTWNAAQPADLGGTTLPPAVSPNAPTKPDIGWQPPGASGLAGLDEPGNTPSQSMTGRLYWRQDVQGSSTGSGPRPTPIQRPGDPLPVRQPLQSLQQPLSPSGSLWERAAEPSNPPTASQESGSRPIYVWSPPDEQASSDASESTDRGDRGKVPDWSEPNWPGTASR